VTTHSATRPWLHLAGLALGTGMASMVRVDGVEAASLTPAFEQLVQQVSQSELAERRIFARIALDAMAESYEAELNRRSKSSGKRRDPGAEGRWRAQAASEAGRLRQRALEVESASRIAIARDGPDSVRLIIDGSNVIIAGPRIDAPQLLEERIVGEACLYLDCRLVVVAPADAAPAYPDANTAADPDATPVEVAAWPSLPLKATAVSGGDWYPLPDGGATFRTSNGLNFEFREALDRPRLAAFCTRLAADLDYLASGLAYAESQRWPVMLEALRLGVPEAGETTVIVNPLGDAFRLALTEPAAVSRLLPQASSWLANRARGRNSQQYFPQADALLQVAATLAVPVATAPATAPAATGVRPGSQPADWQPLAPPGLSPE
jgi:hypothetical protein